MHGISIGCAWQDMFLGWRTTLVLDLNPCFAMRDDPRTSDQVTSNITLHSYQYNWDALMEHAKYDGAFIGASLSEPYTSVTALQDARVYVCLLAAIYCKF